MEEVIEVLHDMECDNCQEKTFQEREGFFYCIECGTQKQQIQAVDLTADEEFNETAAGKHYSRAIRRPKDVAKTGDTDITSWEFYNYVLRGFVQELLEMGAKPELKLMTLQVWAAYLSKMEVAFCRNDGLGLPKLGVRPLHRDARIIYEFQHTKLKKKLRRKGSLSADPNDERSKSRMWNKTKRNLDASGYTKPNEAPESGAEQKIGVRWSWKARKTIKRKMPLKHLDKHSRASSMQCHAWPRVKAKELKSSERYIYNLNLHRLYEVLAIALNMVEDDIQLTDLLRLIEEEHLTSRYMLKYLPENVAAKGKTLLKELELGNQKDQCSYTVFRTHVGYMARFIDVSAFQEPNLLALAERYVLELGLPPRVAKYVGSLIDLHPPRFASHQRFNVYPRYEPRVMAYIVYVMKLLFGLDDVKEKKISMSAKQINEELQNSDGAESQVPMLFVFTEWMQFVELRKEIVAQYNQSFARRFGVANKTDCQVDDILVKDRKQKEQEYGYDEVQGTQRRYENMTHTIESLLKEHFGESVEESIGRNHIEFQHSLTPAHTYFQRILHQGSRTDGATMDIPIPDYMHVDHSQRNLDPFVREADELKQYFAQRGVKMHVGEVACREDIEQVGLFHPLSVVPPASREFRANCDIKTETWINELKRKEKRPDFQFRQPNATYGAAYLARIQQQHQQTRRELLEASNPYWQITPTPSFLIKLNNDEEVLLDTLSSIQTYEEENMDPIEVPLDMPRRHLERRLINSSESEPETNGVFGEDSDLKPPVLEDLVLLVSNFDCWLLHGFTNRMREMDKRALRPYFPYSFRWLLDTCAATIGVGWEVLYEQLLVLEVMFHHSIKDWSTYRHVLSIDSLSSKKDRQLLLRAYKDMW